MQRQRGDQLWIRGEIGRVGRKRKTWPIDILLDTGAGGGNYMSLELWFRVRTLARCRLNRSSAGALEAANPSDSGVPPMRIFGHVTIPIMFDSDSRVRNVTVRVVDGLPYGFIIGAEYLRRNKSCLLYTSPSPRDGLLSRMPSSA